MPRKVIPQAAPSGFQVGSLKDMGAWIKHARTRSGLRIDDAAALCGVSVQLLSSIEAGNRAVGFGKVLQVANKLGLTLLAVPGQSLPAMTAAFETARKRLPS